MANTNNEYWIPSSDAPRTRNYAYNIEVYKDILSNETYGVLRESQELTYGLTNDNDFMARPRVNEIKYVRICTIEDSTVFVPYRNINEKKELDVIKHDNQNYKRIVIYVKDPETNQSKEVGIIYTSDNEIFMTPQDSNVIRFYGPSIIKKAIIEALSNKAVEDRSRIRR